MGMKNWLDRAGGAVKSIHEQARLHLAVILILGLTFLARFLLSTQSYWYDEYLSVVVYGTAHDSLWEAIAFLAEKSIHPPLYQSILYVWIEAFGEGEVQTRALSGLYVAGAALCLYALTIKTHGIRFALACTLVFSLLFIPFYYGMETRSYAQTLFLASLSALALFRYMGVVAVRTDWPTMVFNGWFAVGVAANVAALLTHYYNVFFVASQGGFFLLWFLFRNGLSVRSLVKSMVVALVPLVAFLAIWGNVLVATYMRNTGRYAIEQALPTRAPWVVLHELVIAQNFQVQPALGLVLFILGAALCSVSAVLLYRRQGEERDVANLYFLFGTIIPPILAYMLFAVAGHERYSARYFMFCTPPYALMITMVVFEPARHLSRWWSQVKRSQLLGALGVAVFIAVAIVPETFEAATDAKHDHRGYAQQIVDIVERNPQNSYIVFDVSRRPILEYYLDRMRPRVSVADQILRSQERTDTFFSEAQLVEIVQHGYLLIVFTHDRLNSFPKLLAYLDDRFEFQHSLQGDMGRGILIYRVAEIPSN